MKFCQYVKSNQSRFIKEVKSFQFDPAKFKVGNVYTVFAYHGADGLHDTDEVAPERRFLFNGILVKKSKSDTIITFVCSMNTHIDDITLTKWDTLYHIECQKISTVGMSEVILLTIDIEQLLHYNLDIRPMYTTDWNRNIDIEPDQFDIDNGDTI